MIYDVRAAQARLAELGHAPGPIDGIWGPRTRRAVIAFQREAALPADGIIGPRTREALWGEGARRTSPDRAVPPDLPWLAEAQRLRGLREAPGAADNPVIMDWAADLGVTYPDDETPWCGLFVAHCMRTGLPEADLPANVLGARAWLRFGETAKPQFGAVLVFWRGSPGGWQGHVGFYWAEDDACFHVLGGNQSNAVTVTRIERRRLLGARWPNGVRAEGIVRRASPKGHLISTNEQ
jgi:uncharacterized protein (TIGR02594 family)